MLERNFPMKESPPKIANIYFLTVINMELDLRYYIVKLR